MSYNLARISACTVVALVLVLNTAPIRAAGVEQTALKQQKCLACFEGEKVIVELLYAGNLITGSGLQVIEVSALSEDAQSEGMFDVKSFMPSDEYSPKGFLGKMRSRFRLPFMKKVSNRFRKAKGQLDSVMGGADLTLQPADEADESQIPLEGSEDMCLPTGYAVVRTDGTVGGGLLKDTDADGIGNLFDPQPFLHEEEKSELEDEMEEKAKERLKDEVKDEAMKRRVRIDQELRSRRIGEYRDVQFSARTEVARIPDGVDVWRKGFEQSLQQASKQVATSIVQRQGLWAVLSANPIVAIPTAFAAAKIAQHISDDSDRGTVGGGGNEVTVGIDTIAY